MSDDARGPLRVLLVSHYYPPHLGGIENVVHAEVDQDRASIDYRGTAVPYVYPTNLLEDLKDKIYVSPGVEIYR